MRRGYALVVVLWALVLVGALAAEFHAAARADRRVTANVRAAAAAKWAARAGMARAAAELDRRMMGPAAGQALAAAGDTVIPDLEVPVGDARVHVRVRDPRARLNVNRATAADLSRLFQALGLPEPRAAALAGRIAHRAGAFRSLEELRALEGMEADRYRVVSPFLTAAGDGRINVNSAPAPVLATLPAIDAAAARAIVGRRRRAPFGSVFDILAVLPPAGREAAIRVLPELQDRIAFGPREVEVHSLATIPGTNVRAESRATVALAGGEHATPLRLAER